ncbi:MAG: enoyl-CoA hydratase/isomerase family protein [Alphaproteobacteria bacterium]|nr:enoyl-CoA hydratase/isomerase family protein [Alphaproteobacteria bacterium]
MPVIKVEQSGSVRTVTLARPEKRNALNTEMLDGLYAAFHAAPDRAERVAVIRAEGPVFCAGIDLRERLEKPAGHGESPIEIVLDAIEHYPLPVVAVVQGDAIAGGNELALHADFVVAATTAKFGMSLAQIGLAPTWFLAKKMIEVAGPVASREVLLLGDPISAERMHALGLIARIAPPSGLQAAATSLIERLAANAPLSLRAIKAMLVRQMRYRDGIPHGDVEALVEAARRSADAKEGIQARLEKRTPRFGGE